MGWLRVKTIHVQQLFFSCMKPQSTKLLTKKERVVWSINGKPSLSIEYYVQKRGQNLGNMYSAATIYIS
jgi:hypothetical protein